MLISVITPCFNEEDNVEACRAEVRQVFTERLPQYEYEHIFADNASQDGTLEKLLAMAREDTRVKVIVNARNLGPFRNAFNALKNASGDAVIVQLAADLQDPPAVIAQLAQQWQAGYKVVYGVRRHRPEPVWLRGARWLHYRLVARMADIEVPLDAGEFQLIDRSVVDMLTAVDDYYPYLRGLIARCGQRSIGVEYDWQKRRAGKSKNRLYHLIDQALNGLISMSNVPMRLSVFLGFALAASSFAYALATFILNLVFYGAAPPGIPTLITGLFFFGGVQLFFIGVLGEYIAAIHAQVRRAPAMDVVRRVNFDPPDENGSDAS